MEQSLNLSRPTLSKICKFVRQLCILDLNKDSFRCGSPNQIVDIDESVFNKVKYNKGKDMVHQTKEKQIWVFGIKDRAKNKCYFQAVDNRKTKTLIPIIRKHVLPESIIYSDQWKSYETLKSLPEKYKHYTVNHSEQFLDKRTGCHTNSI
ncbi:unnamed protein product [Brachionus calyciflorus]|uniref:ISXO2-like transposase domain-containing protein n=1 Tax=Brachionus calyciflorus TaxID=104777 RepID=A0A814PAK5_9BILA|nr:unnamed protein product [Brachionus calyciflorus]